MKNKPIVDDSAKEIMAENLTKYVDNMLEGYDDGNLYKAQVKIVKNKGGEE